MGKKKQRIPHKYFPWIDARKKFRLSDAHVQMARELGLSPKKFSSYADTKNQPWKLPLPEFIEAMYAKRFRRAFPEQVQTLEAMAAEHMANREARKTAKESGQVEVSDDTAESNDVEIQQQLIRDSESNHQS